MKKNKAAFKAISFLWLGSILGAGCIFLTQLLLARELGPAAFGAFAAALSMVTLVSSLAGFGVGGFWLKAFGQEGWSAVRWLRGSFTLIVVTTLLMLVAQFVWAVFGPHDPTTSGLLIILSAYLLGQVSVVLVSAKLQLEERYVALALWQILPHLLRLLLVTILVFVTVELMTLYSVAYAYVLISVGMFLVGAFSMWRLYCCQLRLKGHGEASESAYQPSTPPSMQQVAAHAWPFALAGLFYLIYFQSDLILLKYIIGDEAAGIYNVAFLIMAAVYMLPSVVYQKFLMPKIHRWANHDREKFYQVYRMGNQVMLILGLLAMLAIWLLAPRGIPFLFGIHYQESVFITMILGMAAPARFLASSSGAALSTEHHLINKLYIMAIAAMVNVLLNVLIIPVYGVKGAAATTVATEILLVLMMHIYARRRIFAESNRRP